MIAMSHVSHTRIEVASYAVIEHRKRIAKDLRQCYHRQGKLLDSDSMSEADWRQWNKEFDRLAGEEE